MKFTYNDAEYELAEPNTWTTLEFVRLEALTGGKQALEMMTALSEMTPLGVHAGVWVSLRRAGVDVAWDSLEIPWLATMESFRGDPVQAAPDPSTASTEEPKTARRSRSANARSPKK